MLKILNYNKRSSLKDLKSFLAKERLFKMKTHMVSNIIKNVKKNGNG